LIEKVAVYVICGDRLLMFHESDYPEASTRARIRPFSEIPINFEFPVSSSGGISLTLDAVVSAALVAYVFLLLRWKWKS